MNAEIGRSPSIQFPIKNLRVPGRVKQAFYYGRRRACVLIIAVSVCITRLQAQPNGKLTLFQAVEIALKNNYSILKSKIDKDLASENIREKKDARLPDIEMHASYARITDLTEYRHGLGDEKTTQTIPDVADLTGTVRMPLYAGKRIQYNILQAKQENIIAELQLQKATDDIYIEVVDVFLGIYKAMELQKIIQENIKEEKDRLNEVKSFKAHGTVTKNEVLRAELQLLDMQQALMTNQRNTAIGLHDLQTLLQLPDEEIPGIDTSGILDTELPAEDHQKYMNAALQKDEVQIAIQEEDISKTAHKLIKSNYLPVISFFASYGFNYPNYMFFPPNPYLYTLGKVGIEATFSISSLYKNKTKLQAARQRIAAQEIKTRIIKDAVSDNIFRKYMQYMDFYDRIPVAEKAVVQAAENYRIVKAKYLNQLALITEMTDADTELLQAKFNAVSVKIDAVLKYHELLYASGLLRQPH